jgi:hypothetical protein
MDASRNGPDVNFQGGGREVSSVGFSSQHGDYGEDGSVLHDM